MVSGKRLILATVLGSVWYFLGGCSNTQKISSIEVGFTGSPLGIVVKVTEQAPPPNYTVYPVLTTQPGQITTTAPASQPLTVEPVTTKN